MTYETPESHPIPLVGEYKKAGVDPTRCTTYEGRYGMYSDEALGITYRKEPEPEEKQDEIEFEDDDDPENLKPTKKVKGTGARPAGAAAQKAFRASQAAAASDSASSSSSSSSGSSTSSSDSSSDTPEKEKENPLFGPRKPVGMNEGDWERILRDRMWRANVRSEELGPDSFPDWRALMDACYEKHEREQGHGGGVERWDPKARPAGSGAYDEDDEDDVPPKYKTTIENKRTALVMRSYEGYVWVSLGACFRERIHGAGAWEGPDPRFALAPAPAPVSRARDDRLCGRIYVPSPSNSVLALAVSPEHRT